MREATIKVTDNPDGTINVKVDLGEGGLNKDSQAHYAVGRMITLYLDEQEREEE